MSGEEPQHKPTYAEVAASPPPEDGAHSNSENGGKEHKVGVTVREGAHFSKQKSPPAEGGGGAKPKEKSGSTASSTNSEMEIINVEPPPPGKKDGEKPKPDPNVIVDKVVEVVQLKRTSMLTEEEEGLNKTDSDELEVLSDEMESKRRKRQHLAIVATVAVVAGLAIIGVVYWRRARSAGR